MLTKQHPVVYNLYTMLIIRLVYYNFVRLYHSCHQEKTFYYISFVEKI